MAPAKESVTENHGVAGSIPALGTRIFWTLQVDMARIRRYIHRPFNRVGVIDELDHAGAKADRLWQPSASRPGASARTN